MKKLIFILILFLILNLYFALAEEFSITVGQEIEYKHIPIKLVSIGTLNSAVIKVDNEIQKISLNKEIMINNLNIKFLESKYDFIKINVEAAFDCIVDEDCDDKNPCTENICTAYGECSFPKSQGCILEDICVPTGSFSISEDDLLYCSNLFEWEKRKPYNEQCINDYECMSNLCKENTCTKPKDVGEKMAPIWLVIIFGLILLLKGALLFANPAAVKNLAREFSYLKESSYKIIGMFLVIIGIILIVWALA
ncbi:MAG: DUF2065 family protein [Nanoarchaeota archaeon]